MMKKIFYLIFAICTTFCFASTARAQVSSLNTVSSTPEPWTPNQLFAPSTLATLLKADESHPMILNIGKVEDIKDAKHIGPVSQKENLDKLTNEVSTLARNTEIVIYCGCCPFAKCPNVRPAFLELKRLGFTDVKVLYLSTNLETNWIKEGYPLSEK